METTILWPREKLKGSRIWGPGPKVSGLGFRV